MQTPLRHLALLPMLLCSLAAAPLETVQVSKDAGGFVLAPSGKPFVPWGHNYVGSDNRLIEDYWEKEWPSIEEDFAEMKAMRANVVRIHLNVGKFMDAADKPNAKSLDRLAKLVELAERTGIYLDVTGLACYRKADVPAWYDELDDAARWSVQARFWEAIAQRCAKSPAIFCYDLMNEPISPAGKRKPGDWLSGKPFGGYDFVQYIALDPGDRKREQVAVEWIRAMTQAIRKHDREHMITVGLLPWVPKWGHLSGFLPDKVAPELDFVSVHIYPEKGKVNEAIDGLKRFAVGKPVVIEETFNLSCGIDDLEQFLRQSRGIASGWVGHYMGQTIQEFDALAQSKKITLPQVFMHQWLKLFVKLGPEMTAPTKESSN